MSHWRCCCGTAPGSNCCECAPAHGVVFRHDGVTPGPLGTMPFQFIGSHSLRIVRCADRRETVNANLSTDQSWTVVDGDTILGGPVVGGCNAGGSGAIVGCYDTTFQRAFDIPNTGIRINHSNPCVTPHPGYVPTDGAWLFGATLRLVYQFQVQVPGQSNSTRIVSNSPVGTVMQPPFLFIDGVIRSANGIGLGPFINGVVGLDGVWYMVLRPSVEADIEDYDYSGSMIVDTLPNGVPISAAMSGLISVNGDGPGSTEVYETLQVTADADFSDALVQCGTEGLRGFMVEGL